MTKTDLVSFLLGGYVTSLVVCVANGSTFKALLFDTKTKNKIHFTSRKDYKNKGVE